MSCVAALCIGLMLSIAHVRSIRPSALLSVYFFFAVFLDGIRARSYLLREGLDAIGAIQVVVTVAKFVLLILEEIPKTASLKDVNLFKFFGKEAFSGFWSRSLILWINETFILGFNNILTLNDLGNLGPEFSTERLVRTFEGIWQSGKYYLRALYRSQLRPCSNSLYCYSGQNKGARIATRATQTTLGCASSCCPSSNRPLCLSICTAIHCLPCRGHGRSYRCNVR